MLMTGVAMSGRLYGEHGWRKMEKVFASYAAIGNFLSNSQSASSLIRRKMKLSLAIILLPPAKKRRTL